MYVDSLNMFSFEYVIVSLLSPQNTNAAVHHHSVNQDGTSNLTGTSRKPKMALIIFCCFFPQVKNISKHISVSHRARF